MRELATVSMPDGVTAAELRDTLRAAGAVFAYLHGSRVSGSHRPGSDLDVAAWFGRDTDSWSVSLPPSTDLLVLDEAGTELAGRVAQHGVLLFDDDPPARVRWQATASNRYLADAVRRRALVETVLGDG